MEPRNLEYQRGFGNEFATEAVPGALPQGQNSPQRHPLGLYTEQLSGTSFATPRAGNHRTWTYRLRPSVTHKPFQEISRRLLRTAPLDELPCPPNQLRWSPLPIPAEPVDFLDGIVTIGGCGHSDMHSGAGVHLYAANRSMERRFFYNADGEMLIVPQQSLLYIRTELGALDVAPGEIAVIPRGIKLQVDLPEGFARGYICENYGFPFCLPDLGLIGANGLANPHDFLTPVASFADIEGDFRVIAKFAGHLWQASIDHSPFDVVAWRGNNVPYKYNLTAFNCINSVGFDNPDPSIFTVLSSASDVPGTSNVDFAIFPPRWVVAEHTLRVPWFHRNIMSEFMGLIRGVYEGKAGGFVPGGASLHNCMVAHGPDAKSYEHARAADLKPYYLADTLAFMFETRMLLRPTRFALESDLLQRDYFECWQGLHKRFREQ